MINWWHTFDFPEFEAQGKDNSPQKLKWIKMPEDLTGKTVLDVGAWDGYFSFVAEKRGASQVLAIDKTAWAESKLWDPRKNEFIEHSGKEGFDTAARSLNSKVESKEFDIEKEDWSELGKFDITICLGIIYHMKDPFLIIRKLAEVTKEMLVLETHIENVIELPCMFFYPTNELNNDESNWWGPNVHGVIKMLEAAGFKKVKLANLNGPRGVFHAWK